MMYSDELEFDMDWMDRSYPSRPVVKCPGCGRRGAVQRRSGFKMLYEHTCPGPWTVGGNEIIPFWSTPTFRVTMRPTTEEQRERLADYVRRVSGG